MAIEIVYQRVVTSKWNVPSYCKFDLFPGIGALGGLCIFLPLLSRFDTVFFCVFFIVCAFLWFCYIFEIVCVHVSLLFHLMYMLFLRFQQMLEIQFSFDSRNTTQTSFAEYILQYSYTYIYVYIETDNIKPLGYSSRIQESTTVINYSN